MLGTDIINTHTIAVCNSNYLETTFEQGPKKDSSGPVHIAIDVLVTLPAVEDLPPSQPAVHPPAPAAGLAGVGLGYQEDLFAIFLRLRH